jgi:histidinol phosphatase-like PHP family hydrolase
MDKAAVRTEAAPAPFQGAPYSQAIKANGFVFVSGQLGLQPGHTEMAGDAIEAQTAQALDNVEAILREAAETETAIEINSWPNRLDVDEGHARRAKELGVKLVINTDAHADDQLAYMRYGVELARRAWLAPADVLNTLPLDALMAYLKGRRGKA